MRESETMVKLLAVACVVGCVGLEGSESVAATVEGGQRRSVDEIEVLLKLPPKLFARINWRDSRPRDFFQVIEHPKYVPANEAELMMADDERVLGLCMQQVCLAFPTNYLDYHEMVQDVVAGVPVLVTW